MEKDTASILLVVREMTRGFNETNVNIMKAIIQLYIAVCGLLESKERTLVPWAAREGAAFCVQKISDRKLSALCKSLLTSLCVVALPSKIILEAFVNIKGVKSPVAHEEFLKWIQTFCDEFGAAAMGPDIVEILPHQIEVSPNIMTIIALRNTRSICSLRILVLRLQELGSSSLKIHKEATACCVVLHQQIGPHIKALSLSLVKDQRLKTQMQNCLDDNPFNPSILPKVWPKESVACQEKAGDGQQPRNVELSINIPKTNLIMLLPKDICATLVRRSATCVTEKLVSYFLFLYVVQASKDGKTAWKIRKAALEEIELAMS